MALSLGFLCLLSFHILAAAFGELIPGDYQNVTDCSCGYYDHATQNFFTDSAIVYFNETASLPEDILVQETYENKYEKGWNTRYRQGATPSNVDLGRDSSDLTSNTSLELFVNPSTPEHLVVGGSVQTLRHDMFYGSFRSLMRSPRSSAPGSALSMTLYFNSSQTINFDLMNPNDPSTAWVGMFVHEEFPDRDLGVNYSVLSNSSNDISPWDYTEFRVDWTEKEVNYYIGNKMFRSVSRDDEKSFPQTPAALRLKHWSVGNWFTMQGPPSERSIANVGWMRLFFNSSLTTDQDRIELGLRCSLSSACATENMALRGSSPYPQEATQAWVQAANPRGNRNIPKVILIICGVVSFLLLANSLLRRLPSHLHKAPRSTDFKETKLKASVFGQAVGGNFEQFSRSPSLPSLREMSDNGEIASPASSTPAVSSRYSLGQYIYAHVNPAPGSQSPNTNEEPKRYRVSWREYSDGTNELEQKGSSASPSILGNASDGEAEKSESTQSMPSPRDSFTSGLDGSILHRYDEGVAPRAYCACSRQQVVDAASKLPISNNRIDHLAGLLVVSCLLVTAIQFSLTFSPASITPGADVHYKTEWWARKTVGSYFLNLVWVGPFLIISARFLVSDYLETGDLLGVAEKVVGRPFRLILPVLAIAMIEYFCMDSGANNWLEYLASITWSTWPFTTVANNFGYFLSEILELAYLIPNAAPQITFNFCTGILWTIPVQLQGSWVALLGVIVIREIKRPWKRFGYYSFCILMHWYALSWGTYFYFGIMLADLEITYNYRKWLKNHPFVNYPLLGIFLLMGIGGLSLDLATQWTNINYASYEYGIHPDIPTGLPIMFTGATGYPQYYVPKLNGIVFAVGLQSLVELSPLVQKLFSVKLLLYVFPHIFTIYLIHGFIFWSLGSTFFIYLVTHDLAYWKSVAVVAVCCYAVLMLCVPILTPIVGALGKSVVANIWLFAHEVPSPRKPTLYPFPTNFLFVRQEIVQDAEGEATQGGEHNVTVRERNRFQRFVAGLAAMIIPKFSKPPVEPADASLSIARSVSRPDTAMRKVGWRTGMLSKNVAMLRRNNRTHSRPTTRLP